MTAADAARECALLAAGTIEVVGRVAGSSNATFAAVVSTGDDEWFGIYKPVAGERPLHDFEPGLHRRERAAYLLSEHLGWGIVPTTVLRSDAPMGEGSLQWFVEASEEHYFTLVRRPATHTALRRMAVFDVITNNTDRKAGHVLEDAEGRLWGVDHGLCFAAEPKLRTVIWDFAGDRVPDPWLADLAPLADAVPDAVADLLTAREVRALSSRVQRLLDRPVLPFDPSGYAHPWPLV